jgi:hypothetical protein
MTYPTKRTLTICDIQLHPSTAETVFEEAMVQQVLPDAEHPPHPAGLLFVRSLYRAEAEEFPPAYRCLVHSTRGADGGAFGIRRGAHLLGAQATEPRSRPVVGALPDHQAAILAVRSRLVMVTIHLPLRMIPEAFEEELAAALSGEVEVATRVNNIRAAFWTRDETATTDRIEYLVAAFGAFMQPKLRGDTLDQIEAAGATVVNSLAFSHVGTIPGESPARREEAN